MSVEFFEFQKSLGRALAHAEHEAVDSKIVPVHGVLLDSSFHVEGGGISPDRFRYRGGWRKFNLALKRLIDICGSAVALIVLAPFLFVVAVLVCLDSPGPAFFSQVRWGRNQKCITVYKFRTMHTKLGDPDGIRQTIPGDPRVTRMGAVLRRTNIDELPQLWNVLKGDMSLVGPRCHVLDMLAGGQPFDKLVRHYHDRHQMRPGITGLAQIGGFRGPTTDPDLARKRVEFDLLYIRNFSVLLDLKILFRTLVQEMRAGGSGL